MKKIISSLAFGLLTMATITAQIKIGDNPQTLDPASVLELESNSRVLVISRMTTMQMENVSPLQGALVYNTDEECIHYYNGTDWVNICEALDNSFTVSTEAVFNIFSRDSTVVVTQTADNFNFEVNLITGDNIVPTSVNGQVHIQEQSITGGQIQNGSVTFDKLGIGTTSGELLQWNGTQWILVDESALAVTEVDGIIGNEVAGPADATLLLSGTGVDTDPFLLDVNIGGIGTTELADNAVTSLKIVDGEVSDLDLANDAVTLAKMANNAVGTNELIDDGVTADKINLNVAGTGLNQAADGSLEVDNTNINPDWANITNIPAGFADNTDDNTTYTAGAGITLTGTTFSVDNANIDPDWANITNIPAGFADNTDDNTTYTAGTGITLTGTTFSVDNANVDPDWTNITNIPAGFADNTDDNTTYTAGTGITLTGTTFSVNNLAGDVTGAPNANLIANDAVTLPKIANGTATGQLMEWNGTDWVLSQQIILKNQVAEGAGTAGAYTVLDAAITATSIIQLTVEQNTPGNPIMIQLTAQIAGSFSVQVYEFIAGTPTATNANWQYVVIAP